MLLCNCYQLLSASPLARLLLAIRLTIPLRDFKPTLYNRTLPGSKMYMVCLSTHCFLNKKGSHYSIKMPADPLQFSAPATPVDASDKATEEGDSLEIFCQPDPSNVHDQGIDELPARSMDDENPFHDLPDNHSLTEVEPPAGSMEDETPFHNLPDNCTLIAIEPPAGNVEDENPFQQLSNTCPLTPTPDLHLRDDNSGPSEPIALAFQRQGLGNALDTNPRSSPLGTFGEESSPQRPTSPSPTAIRDVPIDPTLFQLPPVGSTLWIVGSLGDHLPATTRTVNAAVPTLSHRSPPLG